MNMSPFRSFSSYLREIYPFPVYKATLDAGFICPNMDGTKGIGGCTFCNNASFSPSFRVRKESILEQLESNIRRFSWARPKIASKNPRFIAFFQAFTGTYGPVELMNEWWRAALSHPQVIGLSVSTRADCLPPEVLDLIQELASQHSEIWLEIGIESTHNETLQKVHRGHLYEDVLRAWEQLQKIPALKTCVHLIHGLPGETEDMMLESVRKVNLLRPTAVKFHHLEIVKDTDLAKTFLAQPFSLLSREEYFQILGKSLQYLDPSIIIQRLFGHSPDEFLIAPRWDDAAKNMQDFLEYLCAEQICQGVVSAERTTSPSTSFL